MNTPATQPRRRPQTTFTIDPLTVERIARILKANPELGSAGRVIDLAVRLLDRDTPPQPPPARG